jgi:hypothetical protein
MAKIYRNLASPNTGSSIYGKLGARMLTSAFRSIKRSEGVRSTVSVEQAFVTLPTVLGAGFKKIQKNGLDLAHTAWPGNCSPVEAFEPFTNFEK